MRLIKGIRLWDLIIKLVTLVFIGADYIKSGSRMRCKEETL